MQKFEYLRTQLPSDSMLNALGDAGWELVGFYHDIYIFKRRKSESGVADPIRFMNELLPYGTQLS